VVGHLREVKDPFLTAQAARLLPTPSTLRVLHAGRAMDRVMEQAALAEQKANPRYQWLGELPRWRVRRLMARSRLLVLSSRMEGGANVISEAAVGSLPVLASRIPGSVGLLGDDYQGFFPVGDAQALADLLWQAEQEQEFLETLRRAMKRLAPVFLPRAEKQTWSFILAEIM